MQDAERHVLAKNPSERRRSIVKQALGTSSRKLSTEASTSASSLYPADRRRSSLTMSMLSASLASFVSEGFPDSDEDGSGGSLGSGSGANGSDTTVLLNGDDEVERSEESRDDNEDVESAKHHSLELQLDMLRGKLARRNMIIEVIRRAYYHDVIVVKEELRHVGKQQQHPVVSRESASNHSARSQPQQQQQGMEDRLAAVPSVDLRDALQLFAPAETVLQVHPCDTCGGHLELVHGEVKERTCVCVSIKWTLTVLTRTTWTFCCCVVCYTLTEQGAAGRAAGDGACVQGRAADAQRRAPHAHGGEGAGGGE